MLKIIDFGLARPVPHATIPQNEDDLYVQSLWWRAPELLLQSSGICPQIDVWSAGCVVAELVFPSEAGALLPGQNELDQNVQVNMESMTIPPTRSEHLVSREKSARRDPHDSFAKFALLQKITRGH